ncbi:TetR/AcrR family transcriptional regulator [Streptomyces hokutonensis]|uniref:TetR/AcrR family transcriptional regulator n=1 Tax=Streptomyces hokutonensis TaxID=1306990 RepID=A0ABW6M798_9ACTN
MAAPAATRREAFRERILSTALDLARQEGWKNLSMRRIADELDYTTPALYYHFKSKDDLIVELQSRGWSALLQKMRGIDESDPAERLKVIARTYVDFAFAEAELFMTMFGFGGVSCESEVAPPAAKAVSAIVNDTAAPLFARELSPAAAEDEVDVFWASVHGTVTLAMTGNLEGGRNRARSLAQIVIERTLRSWAPAEGA